MLAIEQDQRFAVDLRDAFQCTPENFRFLAVDGEFARLRTRRGRFVDGVQGFRRVLARARAFERITSEVAGDAAKPRAQFMRFPEPGSCRQAVRKVSCARS